MSDPSSTSTVTPFRLVQATTLRPDLARRKEIKYALHGSDVAKLRQLLQGNLRRLIHNEKISVVRSIYFDDFRLSACRANLDGIGRRSKLRLRWYDSLRPQKEFFLEIKWRRNRVTGKHRFQMQSGNPLSDLPYKEIRHAVSDAVPEQYVGLVWKYSEPIVIVEYKREHFASLDGRLRVTLDYDLKYYDQTCKQRVSTSFARVAGGFAVLEGKVPIGSESALRGVLAPFAPRASRCSKYVHGCGLLGLIDSGT